MGHKDSSPKHSTMIPDEVVICYSLCMSSSLVLVSVINQTCQIFGSLAVFCGSFAVFWAVLPFFGAVLQFFAAGLLST